MNKMNKAVCPVELAAKIISKKWNALIVRDLLRGVKRFGDLLGSLETICPRMLTLRLLELQRSQIIEKTVKNNQKVYVYRLTKKGEGLAKVIDQMKKWGSTYTI